MNAAIDLDPAILRTRVADEAPSPASQSDADAGTTRWLRYRADRRVVAFVLFTLALHVAVFFLAPTWVAAICCLPIAVLSMFVAPLNHHHQHVNTFQSPALNRIFEIALSLQTGIAPFGWVLHHNLGHHLHYLNQRPHPQPDESKWTRRDGSTMGRLEYTLDLLIHHQLDILRVGRRYPKYLRAYLLMKLPLWSILGLALYIDPANAILIFLVPGFLTLAHTSWVTYGHHAGLHPTNHYDASVTNINPVFNYVTCNLGYHTAHHTRPGIHWSLLPKLHDEIKHRIPPEQVVTGFWD